MFGRAQLPHRSTLSRFLAALGETSVEAQRSVYLQDALSCIHCLNQRQMSGRLPTFLPLIPYCGEIGHALSLAELGYEGLRATWSACEPYPFHYLPPRLQFSRVHSERIGA